MATVRSLLTTSQPPFNDADADIILRSSDNVDFRLHKTILAKASPVFCTMFDLPQPPPSNGEVTDEPQVVQLTENAHTLDNVFRFCYPAEQPNLRTFEDIHAMVEAGRKYDIACIVPNLRWPLTRLLHKNPLRVYAVAYMLQLEDIAREAAKLLLDHSRPYMPPSPPPEFDVLPARALYSIHLYRQECLNAALIDLVNWTWILQGPHDRVTENGVANWVWFKCSGSHNGQPRVQAGGITQPTQQWFQIYASTLTVALHKFPSGTTALSHLMSEETGKVLMRVRGECATCALKAPEDLLHLNQLLMSRIDTAIAKIKVDLPFTHVKTVNRCMVWWSNFLCRDCARPLQNVFSPG